MEEKYMVNDILENIKFEILKYTDALICAENIEVQQIIAQLLSTLEAFNFELFTLATSKGYYLPTAKAKPEEIAQIKKIFL